MNTLRMSFVTTLPLLLVLGLLLLLAATVAGLDNNNPETAEALDQYNHITEYLNATDDTMEYWYYMDISRGDELFVYFYGTGEAYNATRMLYYIRGPDTYDPGTEVHNYGWYRQKENRDDRSNLWHWICPVGGRYYFHFYARNEAVGTFHANVSRDTPIETFRDAVDSGTLWWGGVTSQNKYDVWKIWLNAGPTTVEGVEVTVTWPNDWHRIHLTAYDLVDRYVTNLLNISYAHSGDRREVVRFTASYTGWYYIRLDYGSWSGSEDYGITTQEYSAPNDGDNTPANATFVLKSSSFNGHLEASRDMHDWFEVELVEGDLIGISMEIMDPNNPRYNPGTPNFWNYFEIQVYDPFMRRVNNGYDTNYIWNQEPATSINNLPIQPSDIVMNGTYYIRASFSSSSGYWYDPVNTSGHVIAFCDYVVQITIPNRAPRINQTAMEDVVMLEDTTWWETLAGVNVSSLDLGTVFVDPELGEMTFSATGDANVTARMVGDGVTLKPMPDWHGEAEIVLRADDDSGNHATAILHVLVVPVNDAPRAYATSISVHFLEDDGFPANRTLDLYDLFYDVDEEDEHNLTFSMVPMEGITATFDQVNGTATFMTEVDLNGQFDLTFEATDTHDASLPALVQVMIDPVNDAPKPREGTASYVFLEGFMLETFDAADHIYDPDGDTVLRWLITYTDPADEENLVVLNEGKEPLNSGMVITPGQGRNDWYGTVSVVITCIDTGGLQGEKVLTLEIVNTPDPPEVADWSPRTDTNVAEGDVQSFTISSVLDPDGPTSVLHYSFWMKGPEDIVPLEVQNTTRSTFEMVTDFESEGEYNLQVIVIDEDLLSSASPIDWKITVTKTNRDPLVTILSPEDNQTFKEGKWVEFSASPTDPDPEDIAGLVVEWYEGPTRLGVGSVYSIKNLKPGPHIISVVVTDPEGDSVERTFTVKIKEVDEGPGFGALATLIALVSFGLLARYAGPRRGALRP
jgi:PGF-CTERM protein